MSGVQMNKRPSGQSRKTRLEAELIGDITDKHADFESGKPRHETAEQTATEQKMRTLNIRQGLRRRHPHSVLANFKAITQETTNAESAWERAMMHEQERTTLPTEYVPGDGGMMTNQIGLVTTALDNYKQSKGKFQRTTLVGI